MEDAEMESIAPKIMLDEAEIPVYRVFQPALDVDKPKKYIAYQGAQSVVWQKIEATSVSNSQISWNINTPSVRTGINRQIFIELEVSARAIDKLGNAVTDANFNAALTGRMGVRQFPLQSASNTVSLDLNSSRFSWNPRSSIAALYSYDINMESQNGYFSTTGSCPDMYSTMNASADPAGSFFVGSTTSRNPLGRYSQNMARQSRNITNYDLQRTVNAAANSGNFSVIVTEPILLPPLAAGSREEPCLYGINNLNLNFVLGDTQRLFAVSSASGAAGSDTDFNKFDNINIKKATMHIQYYTFNLTYPLPRTPVWSCSDISNYITRITQTIPEPSITNSGNADIPNKQELDDVVTNSINLNQIPKSIYVFAKRRQGVDNAGSTDTFLRISKISVDFNNRSGLLSTCNEYDLYNMARKNGLKRSYAEVERIGLPLCLSPAEDLSLGDDQSPGLIGQFNLQMTIKFRLPISFPTSVAEAGRRYPITNLFDVQVVVVNEGACWIGPDGILKTKFGMLTENAVLTAPIEYGTYEGYQADVLYGGSFFGKVKSFVNKASKIVQKVAPHVSRISSAVAPALEGTRFDKYGKHLGKLGEYADKAGEYAGVAEQVTGSGRYVSRAALRKKLQRR